MGSKNQSVLNVLNGKMCFNGCLKKKKRKKEVLYVKRIMLQASRLMLYAIFPLMQISLGERLTYRPP